MVSVLMVLIQILPLLFEEKLNLELAMLALVLLTAMLTAMLTAILTVPLAGWVG